MKNRVENCVLSHRPFVWVIYRWFGDEKNEDADANAKSCDKLTNPDSLDEPVHLGIHLFSFLVGPQGAVLQEVAVDVSVHTP